MIPKVIVFDLDFTIWYPEMYLLDGDPRLQNNVLVDGSNTEIAMFPHVPKIIEHLKSNPDFSNTLIAVASRTTYPKRAMFCMQHLKIRVNDIVTSLHSLIDVFCIYDNNKTVHMREIQSKTKVEFEDMLFFDNEYGNIRDVKRLQVLGIHTPDGLTLEDFERGLLEFRKSRNKY